MKYIDEEYYYDILERDLIPEEKFEEYAIRASNTIRNRVLNKDISLFEEEIKDVTCSVAEIFYNQYLIKERIKNISTGAEKIITSEKVGDYSRNISNVSISELEKLCSEEYIKNQIEEELENQLLWTGLLYCGVPYVR